MTAVSEGWVQIGKAELTVAVAGHVTQVRVVDGRWLVDCSCGELDESLDGRGAAMAAAVAHAGVVPRRPRLTVVNDPPALPGGPWQRRWRRDE